MKLRHKAEMKALMAMAAKGIGAKKKQKEDATALEAAQNVQMQELERKEQAEKDAEESGDADGAATTSADGESESASASASVAPSSSSSSSSSAPSGRVPSRAQKKKAAAAAKDQARQAELRELTKDMKDERGEEDAKIAQHMAAEAVKLRVREMVSDGHCLYRAVADQAHRLGMQAELDIQDTRPPFMAARSLAARYIDGHRSDFEAFLLPEDENGNLIPLDANSWKKYLSDLVNEELAVWGGHNEVVALSKALRRPIIIWSADGRMEVGEEFRVANGDLQPMHISFHQHYYGLGAHYNSVITDAEADEAEEFVATAGAEQEDQDEAEEQ